ncbi:hypothetical protein [Alistipes sp. ZOR0009]|uniref:capsular polysaccharide export protein, LipB/KpsS family n=1 Tax=Alistipes sp. ZOR0009 TaxID=1339253 RepID=UPI000645EF9C|nr:hypothetical protein [Alistipes sp. ZOR0009]
MKKKYLILVNAAFKMGHFHKALGDKLQKEGCEIVYAFADKLPMYTENIDFSGQQVYVFSEFFKENFKNISVDEKYYNININKLFFSDYDRNIVYSSMKFKGNDYYKSLMCNLINFFDYIYKRHNVDICIYESISNSFAYAAFEVLKLNGVRYCGYAGCRLKNRFELYTEEFGSVGVFKEKFNKINIGDIDPVDLKYIDNYLSQYSDQDSLPSYHPKNTSLDWNFSIFKRYFDRSKIRLITGAIKYSIFERQYIYYSYQNDNPLIELMRHFLKQLKKQVNIRVADKYFSEIDYKDSYYLYPQHFKPEASTSVLARHFCDDINVIRNIAFNLPFGKLLYVKEHFVNFGRMKNSYYKELRSIPNVKLISHNANTKDLIKNADGVITLTSTVGFEALLMNKPVFIFGETFYKAHPNCVKLNNYEELFNILKNTKVTISNEVNQKFIAAYLRISYEGNIYYSLSNQYKDSQFVDPFINAINEKFSS